MCSATDRGTLISHKIFQILGKEGREHLIFNASIISMPEADKDNNKENFRSEKLYWDLGWVHAEVGLTSDFVL